MSKKENNIKEKQNNFIKKALLVHKGENIDYSKVQYKNNRTPVLLIDKPNFAKTFNELLENAIESNLNVLEEKEKQEFKTEKRNAIYLIKKDKRWFVDFDTVKSEKGKTYGYIYLNNTFYNENKILIEENENLKNSWIALTSLVYKTNMEILNILGINIPEKM